MPIYAFACQQCGHHFDNLQKMSDPDPDVCPVCGAAAVKRQLTAPSFRLAGSGWYETDFKKDGDRKRNLASDNSEPKSAESKEGNASKSDGKSSADSKSDSGSTKDSSKADAKPSVPGTSSSAASAPAPAASKSDSAS